MKKEWEKIQTYLLIYLLFQSSIVFSFCKASLSDSTLAWIASKGFEDGDLENYKFLLQAMEDKISRVSNPLVHQVELHQIQQHQHESADALIQRVQEKAAKCKLQAIKNFTDHQSMITLVKAVQPEVRRKMLLQKVQTFEEACEILKNEEQATADTKKCSQRPAQEAETNAMSGYKRDQRSQHANKYSSQKDRNESQQSSKPFSCIRCHSKDHLEFNCPVLKEGKVCYKCKKVTDEFHGLLVYDLHLPWTHIFILG